MLSVTMLYVVMLCIVMVSVVMLNVTLKQIVSNVVILSALAPRNCMFKNRFVKPRNSYWRGRLSTVDLLINVGYSVIKRKYFQCEKQPIWTIQYKEVNRTDLVPSVRIPWLKQNIFFASETFLEAQSHENLS